MLFRVRSFPCQGLGPITLLTSLWHHPEEEERGHHIRPHLPRASQGYQQGLRGLPWGPPLSRVGGPITWSIFIPDRAAPHYASAGQALHPQVEALLASLQGTTSPSPTVGAIAYRNRPPLPCAPRVRRQGLGPSVSGWGYPPISIRVFGFTSGRFLARPAPPSPDIHSDLPETKVPRRHSQLLLPESPRAGAGAGRVSVGRPLSAVRSPQPSSVQSQLLLTAFRPPAFSSLSRGRAERRGGAQGWAQQQDFRGARSAQKTVLSRPSRPSPRGLETPGTPPDADPRPHPHDEASPPSDSESESRKHHIREHFLRLTALAGRGGGGRSRGAVPGGGPLGPSL